jgi:3-hydroxybutyrate dehydrogenase
MPSGGRIISISSVLGKMGVPGAAAYCASKHGVIGFTKSIALELAGRKITANVICPGWVETQLAEVVMKRAAENSGISFEEFRRNALNGVPLSRMVQPEEVASLVLFLASPAAKNITGQSYSLCGGQTMH